jgi:hypothetical protein
MALIVKANGSESDRIEVSELSLKKMQEIVEGYIERVPCYSADILTHVLYVNEDGRIMGFPLNIGATIAAGRNIVGTAILLTVEEDKQFDRGEL